jgi:hypothetical protein
LAWEAVGIKEMALNANAFPIMVRLDMVSSSLSLGVVDRSAMLLGTVLLVSKTKAATVGAMANPATQRGANSLMLLTTNRGFNNEHFGKREEQLLTVLGCENNMMLTPELPTAVIRHHRDAFSRKSARFRVFETV